jgi:hypothetical protein
MLTLKRLPQQTPAEPMTARGANGIASMPWAWTLHSLFRIIHELPIHIELINKFIYNEIKKDANQELMDLTMEKTAEKLEPFLQIRVKSSNISQTVLATRPAFHCDHHGHSSTHDTAGCRVLNDRRNRQHSKGRDRHSNSYGRIDTKPEWI